MRIKAATAVEKGVLEIRELELGEPRQGEVLVKLAACGICHTDTSTLNLVVPSPLPMVLGHEGVGIVEKAGPGVQSLQPGDHVILSFPSCGNCPSCRNGKPYACDTSSELFFNGIYQSGGTRIKDDEGRDVGSLFGQGGFADHCIVSERSAVKVDPEVDLRPLCSLACGAQTGAGAVLNLMKPTPGDSVAVFGCGAVGMSAIMAAKLAGCSTIIGVDAVPSRLDMALECGATHVINGKECPDIAAEILRLTGGRGTNFALESSGAAVLVPPMLNGLAKEGLAVIVSFAGDVELNMSMIFVGSCRTLAGTVEGAAEPQTFIPKLVQFYKEGRFPVDKLATYYPFDQIHQAFADSASGKSIKPILLFE